MARPTFLKYQEHMAKAPGTFGWHALLVYDRAKANMILAQEHLEFLIGGEWLPLINLKTDTDNGSWRELAGVQLDRPVLSFANADIASSKARLSMNVLGGLIKEFRQVPGSPEAELVSYSILDPLTAPTVRMDIQLKETGDGSVNDQGVVTLDLSNGTGYTFEVSSWKELNEKLGKEIHKVFNEWPAGKQVWELNVLKPVEGELNPTHFRVRTHSLANAMKLSRVSEEEHEEGAILVGVSFEKDVTGNFPDKNGDLPYYLPEPKDVKDDPYSMNIVLSNDAWVRHVLVKKILAMPEFKGFKYTLDPDKSGFYRELTFAASLFSVPGEDNNYGQEPGYSEGGWKYSRQYHSGLSYDDVNLYIRFGKGALSVGVEIDALVDFSCTFLYGGSVWSTADRPGRVKIDFKKEYAVKLLPDGTLKIEPGSVVEDVEITTEVEQGFNLAAGYYVLTKCRDAFVKPISDTFKSFTNAIDKAGIEVDVFRLNGLLFRGGDVAVPRDGEFGGDFSLLGDLNKKYTSFALAPFEKTISASEIFSFDALPGSIGEVEWTLKALPNESGKLGLIDKGRYTAPSADDIEGTYKRVIVTATAGGQQSSALVTVVPGSISVYPYLLVAQFATEQTTPRYVLVGGDISNDLTWSMVSGSKGDQRLPGDDDTDLDIPEGKNVRIYVSPVRTPGEAGEVEALVHLDRVQVSAGGLTQWIDVIIPWTTTSARIKSTKTANGGLQLAVAYDSAETGDEEQLTPGETKWKVLLGNGKIDPLTGIYQPATNEGPYIIVAGRETPAERLAIWAYKVLVLSAGAKRAVALDPNSGKEIQS